MDPAPPVKRSSAGPAIIAALVICASAVGVMVYELRQHERIVPDNPSGFDLARVREAQQAAANGSPGAPSPEQKSGLDMLSTNLPDMRGVAGESRTLPGMKPGQAGKAPPKDARTAFTEAIHNSEASAQALAQRYTKQYPVIQKYGQEWMSHPDLKKLNDDYMRDHDPAKFLHGLVQSQSFLPLAVKYAGEPAVQAFIKEAIHNASSELLTAALDYFDQDKPLQNMVTQSPLKAYMPFVDPKAAASGALPPPPAP
jgi:hypothetical protein